MVDDDQATEEVGFERRQRDLLGRYPALYQLLSGGRETGIFVGLWVPTVLQLSQNLIETEKD